MLLLIYDEAAINTLLHDNQIAGLPAQYGYPAGYDPGEALRYLQPRFSDSGFPHEIGVFFGHPAEDVWVFIVK